MKAKVFTERSTKDVAEKLERQFNDWLAAEPAARQVIVEKLTHPTFGLDPRSKRRGLQEETASQAGRPRRWVLGSHSCLPKA